MLQNSDLQLSRTSYTACKLIERSGASSRSLCQPNPSSSALYVTSGHSQHFGACAQSRQKTETRVTPLYFLRERPQLAYISEPSRKCAANIMYNNAQQRRCECTLPFSLHLTVMILGIVGVILGIVAVAVYFYIANFWPIVSGALAFASGLQGLLVRPGSGCFNCHIVLAVFNLANLGVFGIACLFLISPFWVIWAIAAFALELWITIVRFCCKSSALATTPSTELPVAQPGVVHVVQGHSAHDSGAAGYKQPYRN